LSLKFETWFSYLNGSIIFNQSNPAVKHIWFDGWSDFLASLERDWVLL
jgi:hypothetical protein